MTDLSLYLSQTRPQPLTGARLRPGLASRQRHTLAVASPDARLQHRDPTSRSTRIVLAPPQSRGLGVQLLGVMAGQRQSPA